MKNNLITTHVNGYFAGNYSSIEAVPANKTVCEVFYDGTFQTPFFNGTEWIEKATVEEITEKQNKILQNLKKQQYIELSETDWYYTRFLETGQEVPLEIKQQRLDIREKYNNLIREINNE